MGKAAANEPYQVVARRFRPKAFGEMVGQDAIQSTLRSELATGRVPHAFLFAGSRGVGKTTTARILARCLTHKYTGLAASGWEILESDIQRDVTELLGGGFDRFLRS